ncbi:MAG: acetylglutamate kinase [Paramuribaculum sp.]|nr:acetylglutamate kinase [Paramuribaculum sp.]
MQETIKIFKIGGNVIDNSEALKRFISDFARIKGPKILVHGGGKEATRLSQRLGIPPKMIDGRRITDENTIDIVTMVYAGLINKRIVSLLQAEGVDAIGLSGADGNAITAQRRAPKPIDFGFVGDIDPRNVNRPFLLSLLQQGITPVFCAIMHDGKGALLNCNADSVASAVAVALSENASVELIYCFEKDGVLADIDDPSSLISIITPQLYDEMKEKGTVNSGMLPKIDNAFNALYKGVESVTIKNSENLLFDRGTKITRL